MFDFGNHARKFYDNNHDRCVLAEIDQQRRLEFERSAGPFMREKVRLYELLTGVEYNDVTKEFSYIGSPEAKKMFDKIDETIKMYWDKVMQPISVHDYTLADSKLRYAR